MSALQSGSRRLSARLQEKDNTQPDSNAGSKIGGAARGKKRKNEYEEEDDGFQFSRAKGKRPRKSKDNATAEAPLVTQAAPLKNEKKRRVSVDKRALPSIEEKQAVPPKEKRKRMSFSTPSSKTVQPVRRSKRLSHEASDRNGSPVLDAKQTNTPKQSEPIAKSKTPTLKTPKPAETQMEPVKKDTKTTEPQTEEKSPANLMSEDKSGPQHSSTKISLPFADTPIIRRNKAMREGRGSKGDRRSSLGLRGRRASSLIETGNSNALPHTEVDSREFYKHIESDMMEPRRIRQLLTWCATRAVHQIPRGTDHEDSSAKGAVRVIEEELLKELTTNSELSDWFSRQDVPTSSEPLPERPNPKNLQNTEKIAELEQQIQRLRRERDALESLLQPPDIPIIGESDPERRPKDIDKSLLSEEEVASLESIQLSSSVYEDITQRLVSISSSLGTSIDVFADGIHKVAQYRNAADNVSSQVLSLCAKRIAEREREGRKKALHLEDDRSPGRDLSSVLRGLSKTDR